MSPPLLSMGRMRARLSLPRCVLQLTRCPCMRIIPPPFDLPMESFDLPMTSITDPCHCSHVGLKQSRWSHTLAWMLMQHWLPAKQHGLVRMLWSLGRAAHSKEDEEHWRARECSTSIMIGTTYRMAASLRSC